jgi:hypothetical protein
MVRQVNPGLARLYLDGKSRQYGYQNPLVLQELSLGAQRALDYLEQGIADDQLGLLAKMASADPNEVADLLSRLGPHLRRSGSMLPELQEAEVRLRFREILRLFASTNLDPATAMKNRKAARVFIAALSPFGLTLARGFAAAGIGLLLSDDQVRVSSTDFGPLGFDEEDLGKPRAIAARDLLSGAIQIQHHSRVASGFDRVDLAVLIGTDVLNPSKYQRWLSRDIPHLQVIFDETGVEISHLVLPGITPCLGCLQLAKMKRDATWQVVATQLDYLERDLSDSASTLFAAGVVVSRALQRIDNPLPQTNPRAVRLDQTSGVMELEVPAENCGCR